METPTRRTPAGQGEGSHNDTPQGASIEIKATSAAVAELSKEEAVKLTAEIKAWAGTLWQKLKEAHDGKAWRAMGYTSWSEYLSTEFDISRSRGYQLIAHANAIAELTDAAGVDVSTNVDTLTEGQTRNLDVAAVADEVRTQVADLAEEATDEDRKVLLRNTLAAQKKKSEHLSLVKPKATRKPVARRKSRRTHYEMLETLTTTLDGLRMAFDDIRSADDIDGSVTRDGAICLSHELVAPLKQLQLVVDAIHDRAEVDR